MALGMTFWRLQGVARDWLSGVIGSLGQAVGRPGVSVSPSASRPSQNGPALGPSRGVAQ